MKSNNLIQEKSFKFAVRIIKAYQFLVKNKNEFVLSKQLLKCGTSIGANVEEAIGAQSRADFISKLSISYKEGRETHYWLRLLKETGYFTKDESESLLKDVEEILKILTKIQLSMKKRGGGLVITDY